MQHDNEKSEVFFIVRTSKTRGILMLVGNSLDELKKTSFYHYVIHWAIKCQFVEENSV